MRVQVQMNTGLGYEAIRTSTIEIVALPTARSNESGRRVLQTMLKAALRFGAVASPNADRVPAIPAERSRMSLRNLSSASFARHFAHPTNFRIARRALLRALAVVLFRRRSISWMSAPTFEEEISQLVRSIVVRSGGDSFQSVVDAAAAAFGSTKDAIAFVYAGEIGAGLSGCSV